MATMEEREFHILHSTPVWLKVRKWLTTEPETYKITLSILKYGYNRRDWK